MITVQKSGRLLTRRSTSSAPAASISSSRSFIAFAFLAIELCVIRVDLREHPITDDYERGAGSSGNLTGVIRSAPHRSRRRLHVGIG
jgi:hypothetical protein